MSYLACRSALRMPLESMRVRVSYLTCPSDHVGAGPEWKRTWWSNWEGSSEAMAPALFLVPVVSRNQGIGNSFWSFDGVAMCPQQTALTFTRYEPVRRTQVSVTIPDYRLAPEAAEEQ